MTWARGNGVQNLGVGRQAGVEQLFGNFEFEYVTNIHWMGLQLCALAQRTWPRKHRGYPQEWSEHVGWAGWQWWPTSTCTVSIWYESGRSFKFDPSYTSGPHSQAWNAEMIHAPSPCSWIGATTEPHHNYSNSNRNNDAATTGTHENDRINGSNNKQPMRLHFDFGLK